MINESIIDELISSLAIKKISFDEYINGIEYITDNFMLEQGKKLNINYVGGKCLISRKKRLLNLDKVVTKIEIYGKSLESDEWKVSSIVQEKLVQLFDTDEKTVSELNKLLTKPLELKVEPPVEEEEE